MQVFALVIFFTALLSDDTVHSDQADAADAFLSCIIGVKLVCTNYEVVVLGEKKFPISLHWISCSPHALAENRHCTILYWGYVIGSVRWVVLYNGPIDWLLTYYAELWFVSIWRHMWL